MEDINLKLNIDESAVKKALPSLKELRKELKAIQDQMAGMEEGSDEFLAAANKAGTLKHQIDEIRQATAGASADFGDMLGNVTKAAAGLTGAFLVVQGSLSLLGVESESVTESIKTMQSMMAITQGLASIDNGIKALDKLRNAITGTTVVAKALRAALTPKAILALTAAITAAVMIFKKFRKESEEQQKALEEQKKAAQDLANAWGDKVSGSLSKTLVEYEKLRQSFAKLSTTAEKQKWIEENKKALEGLGLSINDVNDAEWAFVSNTSQVIEAFKLRAEAAANESLAAEKMTEYVKRKAAAEAQMRAGDQDAYWKAINDPVFQQLKADADRYIETGTYLKQRADELLNAGHQTAKSAVNNDNNGKKSVTTENENTTEKEVNALKEKMTLEIAELNLKKERGEADAQGINYLSELINIQGKYRQLLVDIKEPQMDLKEEILAIDTAIAKTNNDISNFNIDKEFENIDNKLAEVNYNYLISNQTGADYITLLEQTLELEKERLDLMSRTGMEGSAAWYQLKEAILEYENELKNALAGNDTLKKTMSNVSKVGTAAMGAIGNVLNDLAATQDQTSREGFETAKKLNIAAATMSMLTGLVEIWAGTFTTKTGPWDYALMAIQSAALIATSAININNIKKQTFDSAGSTSTSTSGISNSAVSASITPPVLSVLEVQGAEIIGAIADLKIYVSEVDLQRINKKVTVQEAENTY